MMFSIIVAIDNEYELTNNFIENLFVTTSFDNGEIIIVADGCNYTTTIKYLKEISEKNKKITFILNEHKSGYGIANNLAIEHSSGDYLVFINSDVLPKDKSIEKLVTYLINNPEVGAVQGLLIYPQNNLVQSTGHLFIDNHNTHVYKGKNPNDPIVQIISTRQALSTAFCAIPRYLFEHHHGFDSCYYNAYEGMELTLKISLSGKKCVYYPEAIAYHITGVSRNQIPYNDKLSGIHFWKKWNSEIVYDLTKYIQPQVKQEMKNQIYFCVVCGHLCKWNKILDKLEFNISGNITVKNLYSSKIDLYTTLPYSAIRYDGPYIFLADSILELSGNRNWAEVRNNMQDLIIDAHGNLGYFNAIIGGSNS